ncbi:MAG: MFS transporter [Chthoniobacterales bacterium]
MSTRREIVTVYAAGLAQGLALVTFPAASEVFTNPHAYALSSSQYGLMFLPQVVLAIAASLLGTSWRRRFGLPRVYLLGLAANLAAMVLLVASQFVMQQHTFAYVLLLAATAAMGVGFGFTVPALNAFAAIFFPQKTDAAVLAMNALLGLGTALAPAFIALFVKLGVWWALPLLVSLLLIALLVFSAAEKLPDASASSGKSSRSGHAIPARFWIFAAFVFLYGICETLNGNWAGLYLKQHFGATAARASLGLTMFWGMVTAGRVLFAGIEKWIPERWVGRVLPFVVAAAFALLAWLPQSRATLGLGGFALAGLGCSALLPLALSFGQRQLKSMSASVAGGLIAFYQLGYGVAAFGVGPLQHFAGLTLAPIFAATAAVALLLGVLSFVIMRTTL